jgi:hypothetical protein
MEGLYLVEKRNTAPCSDGAERILVMFDVRIPGVAGRMHREWAAWREHAKVEALGRDHFVLVVRPGVESPR